MLASGGDAAQLKTKGAAMTMILQALHVSHVFPAFGRGSSARGRAASNVVEYKVIFAGMLAFLAGGGAIVVHALNAVTAFH
jgi:ABC-type transport system involved in cytochrome c biogenesis permease component